MGFGTLFIGYFLLLNLTYYGVTDSIAALIMLLGLYKLSGINRPFLTARNIAVGFTVYGIAELAVTFLEMFSLAEMGELAVALMAIVRHILIAALTVSILSGIREVADEVGLSDISRKARRRSALTLVIYGAWIILEAPALFSLIPTGWVAYAYSVLYIAAILSLIALIIMNLILIYGCYMQICMPGEEMGRKRKPSRFAFVNEYRDREAEKEREMEEYRREKMKRKKERRRK